MTIVDSPRTILKTLKAAKRILIPLHLSPDGDSVGSTLAFYHFLRDLNKNVVTVGTDPAPEISLFLPGAKRIKNVDPANLDLNQFDALLLLDNADASRFTHSKNFNRPPKLLLINIDHHITNPNFGDLNYVVPEASSACEVIYDLFKLWKVKITPEIASCLLTGIYTDTGGFLFPATDAGSLSKAADLIRRGANREAVVENSFRSWSPKIPKIWSMILNNAKNKGDLVYSTLSYKELSQSKVNPAELYSARSFAVNNFLLAVAGIKAAALFSEEKPRYIRVNLRSKGKYDVSKIAHDLGGGGHRNTAAFGINLPLKKVVAKTIRLLKT